MIEETNSLVGILLDLSEEFSCWFPVYASQSTSFNLIGGMCRSGCGRLTTYTKLVWRPVSNGDSRREALCPYCYTKGIYEPYFSLWRWREGSANIS